MFTFTMDKMRHAPNPMDKLIYGISSLNLQNLIIKFYSFMNKCEHWSWGNETKTV